MRPLLRKVFLTAFLVFLAVPPVLVQKGRSVFGTLLRIPTGSNGKVVSVTGDDSRAGRGPRWNLPWQ